MPLVLKTPVGKPSAKYSCSKCWQLILPTREKVMRGGGGGGAGSSDPGSLETGVPSDDKDYVSQAQHMGISETTHLSMNT